MLNTRSSDSNVFIGISNEMADRSSFMEVGARLEVHKSGVSPILVVVAVVVLFITVRAWLPCCAFDAWRRFLF